MKILDTTLRDGSYVVDFKFTVQDTMDISAGLQDAGIELIEVGHGIGLGATRKGISPAIVSDEEYAKAASQVVSKADWGMFCIPGIAELDDISMCAEYGMDFIRIGVNVDAVELAEEFVICAKKHKMFVAVNFMKSYTQPPNKFSKLVAQVQNYGADIAYLVDSAGNMTPDMVKAYYMDVKATSSIALGFHGHNNLGLANANALIALQCGGEIIDTSLQGMGRCTGNTVTEQFVSLLDKMEISHRFDLLALMDISELNVRPMITQTGWDSVDITCGLAGFHSSYMAVIKKYSIRHDIDPRKLILAVCDENQLEAPDELVEKKAIMLKEIARNTGWKHKFPLDRYFGNEQTTLKT